jgi:hypothetical protein
LQYQTDHFGFVRRARNAFKRRGIESLQDPRAIGKEAWEGYLAEDAVLPHRQVALKFLPETMQQDAIARKRFLREAQSAAAQSSFCVRIHEIRLKEALLSWSTLLVRR